MSFLNITDPKRRDSIVGDYLATVRRLQRRDINERAQDLVRQDGLNRMIEPGEVREVDRGYHQITSPDSRRNENAERSPRGYRAGNRSSLNRNQIVSILNELLRRDIDKRI